MKPSLGRIVLLKSVGRENVKDVIFPAIVTGVCADGTTIDCVAFTHGQGQGFYPYYEVPFVDSSVDKNPSYRHWYWPPKV